MTRGYTDHEQFDDLGIIHMNGRIYDADLGRFLSADPLVPHPYFSQSYNRYSYVLNNPMSLTDPSGFEDDKCQGRWGDIPLEDAEELDICGGFGSCNPGTSPSPAPSAPKGPTLIKQYTQNPSTRAYHFVEKRMSDFNRWGSAPEFSRDWDRQSFANVGSAVAPDAVASGEVGGGGFSGWLDNIQLGLDVAGMTPGLGAAADATNAVIHLARGNWAGAALSSIAIIPLIGDAAALAKMADRAADAAKAGGKETIVLGEGMADRVIPTAKANGANWYDPPNAPPEKWMENNKNWLNEKMDQGCRILDCGAAPGRTNSPGPTSPYYKMELEQIKLRKYPNYEKIKALGE